jgi:hypothetical protein
MRRQTLGKTQVSASRIFATLIVSALLAGSATAQGKPPTSWDGLMLVKSKRLDIVYLQPGADFSGYTKVMLDPTEVAFHKNWQRDYNSSNSRNLAARVSDSDVHEAIAKGIAASNEILAEAWTTGGYAVVTQPGPDVLRVKTGVVNIWVNAPDRPSAGRVYTLAPEAGQATFFVEVRDSMTGALLGRAVDQEYAGDVGSSLRTSVSNRGDFRELVETWGRDGVRGLNELKALSPIRP